MDDQTALPLTYDEALTVETLHYTGNGPCRVDVGPRGGRTEKVVHVRRNGRTQIWKTRPGQFRLPVKYGIRARGQFSITQHEAAAYHPAQRCPAHLY
jgi:hypothetical protein